LGLGLHLILPPLIKWNILLLQVVAAAGIVMVPEAVAVDFALPRDFLYQQEQVIPSLLVRAVQIKGQQITAQTVATLYLQQSLLPAAAAAVV
jgi:hypothetical protein